MIAVLSQEFFLMASVQAFRRVSSKTQRVIIISLKCCKQIVRKFLVI